MPISAAAYEQALQAVMRAAHAAFLTRLFTRTLDGHNAHLSDGIQRILGRAPRDFAAFARKAAAAGAWA